MLQLKHFCTNFRFYYYFKCVSLHAHRKNNLHLKKLRPLFWRATLRPVCLCCWTQLHWSQLLLLRRHVVPTPPVSGLTDASHHRQQTGGDGGGDIASPVWIRDRHSYVYRPTEWRRLQSSQLKAECAAAPVARLLPDSSAEFGFCIF